MTLVIMAAGMGSRYGGLKQVDPINKNGEFIIDYSIFDAVEAGFDHVVFVIKRENYDIFRETVGKRIENKVSVSYAFQEISDLPKGYTVPDGREKPWGTGHAVLAARDVVNDPFVVINSDDFYGREAFISLYDFLSNSKKDPKKAHYAMAGYILENTITEYGSVSRGVCETNDCSMLKRVVERTKIQENDGKTQYMENGKWIDIDRKSVVSMNCWAFTPDIFSSMMKGFSDFLGKLSSAENPLKSEFFIPFHIQNLIDGGLCDVKVLKTDAKWYGVTYKEDKPKIVEFINNQTNLGIYPDGLWK